MAMTSIAKTPIPKSNKILRSPWRACSRACPMAPGIPVKILVAIIIEIPLPIPRSEICSPSHIKKIVPATTLKTAEMKNEVPGSYAKPLAPSVTAKAEAWTNASTTVPYLVY